MRSPFLDRLSNRDIGSRIGVAVFFLFLVLAIGFGLSGWYGTAFLFALFSGIYSLFLFQDSPPTNEVFNGVFDEPADLLQFAVRLSLRAGSIEYGSDLGVVSFSDGWLHYQGKLTEFHLARDSTKQDRRPVDMRDATELRVKLDDGSVDATAIFWPVTRNGSTAVRPPEELLGSWRQWRNTPRSGRSLFPPRVPQNRTISKQRLKAIRLRASLAFVSLMALILVVYVDLELSGMALLAIATGWLFFYVRAAMSARTVTALERLSREEPCIPLVRKLNSQVRWAPLDPRWIMRR